jgi:ABC-type uncharacterized transport system substrate-binding protein
VPGPILSPHRREVAALAVKRRLPVIYDRAEEVEAGGLMRLRRDHCRLAPARRNLCGQNSQSIKPAELPVEQPMKFEFMINLKAAKQIGLTIPPNVLARADKVIR